VVFDNSRALKVIVAVTVFIFDLIGCSTVQFSKQDLRSYDHYRWKTQEKGFKIALDPYNEDKRVEEAFGFDLLSIRVFPIFVSIENQNAEGHYLLIEEKTFLIMKNSEASGNFNAATKEGIEVPEFQGAQGTSATAEGLTYGGMLFFPLLLPAAIFSNSAILQMENRALIQKNLEDGKILPKTLYQGGAQNGFLFFRVNKKEDFERVQGVNIAIRNLRTDELLIFTINITNK
jgi:hypothetical protein